MDKMIEGRSRTSHMDFLHNVPSTVGRLTITHVGPYRRGDNGRYPTAKVVCEGDMENYWSTHILVWNTDRDSWSLCDGAYLINTYEEALKNLR